MLHDSAWPLGLLLPFVLYFAGCALSLKMRGQRGQAQHFASEFDARRFGTFGAWLRQVGAASLEPAARWLLAARVGPNALSAAGVLLCLVAGGSIALGGLTLGGVLGLLGCSLDYFDGRVARSSHRASRAGAFLDGVLDRCGEFAFLGGAALLLRDRWWALLACLWALGASSAFSYARAKAEALGVELRAGWMQRPERALLFCLGACASTPLDGLLPFAERGQHRAFAWTIAALAVLSTQSAWQRALRGFRELRRGEPAYTREGVDDSPRQEAPQLGGRATK